MTPPAAAASFDWSHFVARAGTEGRQWVDEYRRHEGVAGEAMECLLLARRRRLDESGARLERLGGRMEALRREDPAVRCVMERWYHGVLGYYWYCREAYGPAVDAMRLADRAVVAAIGHQRAVLPLAFHCHEFRLHHARIARNQRRWDEMRAWVDEVEAVLRGALPLCVLADGTAVGVPELKSFYASLGPLTPAEEAHLGDTLDDGARMGHFERFVRQMERLPGFVIPYP